MRLLLDTQIFLWYISADHRLPRACRDAISNPDNQVYLQRAAHQIADLSLEEGALIHLARLPSLHRDPFDRIIVAQALQHGLTLVTLDDAVRAYPVGMLPAT